MRRFSFFTRLLLLFLLLFFPGPGFGWGSEHVVVLYPKVEEPYLAIFKTILDGIASDAGSSLTSYPVSGDVDSEQIAASLRKERPSAVIALGKQGFQAARGVPADVPIVVGALHVPPEGLSGISLSADPDRLFHHLKELVPRIRKVQVVFDPEANGWLMERARKAASERGLQFSAYPVKDLREAAHRYRDILDTLDRKTEAIWLPLDNIAANDEVILPMLLQQAWDNDLVIFSSKPSHAQRGALFSMLPDNFAMGRSLGAMARRMGDGATPQGLVPLADLKVAVNLRTASHLGLNFSPRQQESFGLTFPTR